MQVGCLINLRRLRIGDYGGQNGRNFPSLYMHHEEDGFDQMRQLNGVYVFHVIQLSIKTRKW